MIIKTGFTYIVAGTKKKVQALFKKCKNKSGSIRTARFCKSRLILGWIVGLEPTVFRTTI